MTRLVVRASMGTTSAWKELAPAFTRTSGHELDVTQENTGTVARILAGEAPADLIVMYGEPLQEIIRRGLVQPESVTVFARAAVGLSVKSGAPWPDIGTPEALKRTLLGAKSVCFSYGGSGQVAERAIEKLGIADAMKDRIVRSVGGPAAAYVARGEAEMAIQQVNVSKPIVGTDYVGDLPAELHDFVVFSIAITTGCKQQEAARELIRFVTSAEAAPLLKKAMMEPAST